MSGKRLSANYSPGLAASKQLWVAHSSYQAPDSVNSSFFYLFSLYLMKVEVPSVGHLGLFISPLYSAPHRGLWKKPPRGVVISILPTGIKRMFFLWRFL
jgi:hypothetical protein